MIPKVIWQTYKDSFISLPEYAKEATQTWVNQNPDYIYRYMDDEKAARFVLAAYGNEWHDIFMSVPVGVMRGDLWRYLVIYRWGGVYSDIDTVCNVPISTWLKPEYDLAFCPENDIHLCQWTFAARAGHPLIKSVLDEIRIRFKSADYSKDHFVHDLTGPGVWTYGILKPLGLESMGNINLNFMKINDSDLSKEYGVHCFGGEDKRIFHEESVTHLYGSQNWNDGQYVQWVQHAIDKKNEGL